MGAYRSIEEFREVTDRTFGLLREVANRYFQGKLNVLIALARRQVKIGGDLKLALTLVPITQPLGPRYREMLAADYPHLLV